jgi:hypothetical protein
MNIVWMSDFEKDARQADPDRLAKVLRIAAGPPPPWLPEELRTLLLHHLNAPMPFDLASMNAPTSGLRRGVEENEGLLIKNFADLLRHPFPPVALLQMVKNFAKAHVDHPESPMPAEIARVLYFAAISAAWVRRDERITSLAPAELRHGLEWTAGEPWVVEWVRVLCRECLERISHE